MLVKNIGGILLAAGVSLFSVQLAQASELDLALSKETAAAELTLDTGLINGNNARLELGGLYNESDDLVGYVGLTSGNAITPEQIYSLGVGARLYYGAVDTPDVDVTGIALGITGKLKFVVGMPLVLAGDFHYAPKITTFSDGDAILDTRIRLETSVSQNATAFIGYRNLKFDLKSHADYDVDDFVQLGVRFGF